MNVKSIFYGVLGAIALVWVWLAPAAIALPNGDSHESYVQNQALNLPATLTASKPETKINLYPEPGTRQQRIGYGRRGDGVTVLEQVSRNGSETWYAVRFDNPPHAEGWVQGHFLAISGAESVTPQNAQTPWNQNNQDTDWGDRSSVQRSQDTYAHDNRY